MPTSVTLRSVKGANLTPAEADANISNLRDTADAAQTAAATAQSTANGRQPAHAKLTTIAGLGGADTAASILSGLGGASAGSADVVALTTHTLVAADLGRILQQQSTSPLTLSVNTTAASGIPWVPGKYFGLGSDNTGSVTLTALSGVTFTNVGSLTVIEGAAPLMVMMSRTTDRWLVL